jgi:hypothetical protein
MQRRTQEKQSPFSVIMQQNSKKSMPMKTSQTFVRNLGSGVDDDWHDFSRH